MVEEGPLKRLIGPGMYPVEYASGLLNPLRNLIVPAARVASRLSLQATSRVLEIGCGPGYFSPTVAKQLPEGRLTLFDAQQGMLDIASQRLRSRGFDNFLAVQGAAESLPFSSSEFDTVFLVTVLGEIRDREGAMFEIARVLKPNGLLSITEQWGDPDRMQQAELNALAQRAGFRADRLWRGLLVETFNYRKTPGS